ncbi:MAG: putative RNA methyltransferase [Aggregatilineales bacterium]
MIQNNTILILKCPVCDASLVRDEAQYGCENGHHFDVSKEGYINLLLSNQKKSKLPGDSAEMMQHRRQFLQTGHYAPPGTRINYWQEIIA